MKKEEIRKADRRKPKQPQMASRYILKLIVAPFLEMSKNEPFWKKIKIVFDSFSGNFAFIILPVLFRALDHDVFVFYVVHYCQQSFRLKIKNIFNSKIFQKFKIFRKLKIFFFTIFQKTHKFLFFAYQKSISCFKIFLPLR